MKWISVEERLPEPGKKVLAAFKNRSGRWRRIIAYYVERWTMEAEPDEGIGYEYSEDDDEYYFQEGWYECIENWPEYTSVTVCEGEVTHWMPLPDPPQEEGR